MHMKKKQHMKKTKKKNNVFSDQNQYGQGKYASFLRSSAKSTREKVSVHLYVGVRKSIQILFYLVLQKNGWVCLRD